MTRSRYRIVQYADHATYGIQERQGFLWTYWVHISIYPWNGDKAPRLIETLDTLDKAKAALARCQAAEVSQRRGWHPVEETRATTPLFDTWLDRLLFWALWVMVADLLLMEAYATYHMLYG